MNTAALRWDGLVELYAYLETLPEDLTAEARGIVFDKAESAYEEIYNGYPIRTGNLKDHLTVRRSYGRGRYGASAMVKNTAPHASLFEHGTQARHTSLGADRGAMPAGNVFVPVIVRKRAEMYEELKAMLVRRGLKVSGDA